MTYDEINTAIKSSTIPAHMVTADSDSFRLPGVVIYWDSQDRSNEGWAYRSTSDLCVDTMQWGHEESGEIDSADDLAGLIELAEQHCVALEAA